MTVEHLRPLLDLVRDQQLFCKVAERLARADVPPPIVEAIRMGANLCDPGHWNQMRWSQALLEEGGNMKQRQGVERHFRQEVLFERMGSRDRAILRSHGGSGAGLALTASPTTLMTKIPPHLFRTILLRRLRLPLPFSRCMCRCGRPIDSFGHHRASCTRTGALGRRGFALESAAARVCREAGARVTTNVLVRDLDLPLPEAADNRRLEVVADGLPHRGAADTDGVVLQRARRRKERRYPELVGRGSRARLVVLAVEVGGRWSPELQTFVAQLAKSKAREQNLSFCRKGLNKRGGCGGGLSSLVQLQRRLPRVSWT